jgi:hypothetical protein
MTRKEAFDFAESELKSMLSNLENLKVYYVKVGSLLEHDLDKALTHLHNAQFALHEKDAIKTRPTGRYHAPSKKGLGART